LQHNESILHTILANFEQIKVGLTERKIKVRINENEHNSTFKNKKYNNSTILSSYLWELKDNKQIN